jgi:hypothetical protein
MTAAHHPAPADPAELTQARDLLERGEGRAAVDLLVEATRHADAPALEAALVDVRHRAAAALVPPTPDRPVSDGDRSFAPDAIPEVAAAELTPQALAGALAHHGSLLVRGLLPAETAGSLLADTLRAFAAADAHSEGAPVADTAPWYVPFDPQPGFSFGGIERAFAHVLGGVLSVESPRTLAHIVEAFGRAGIGELLEAYFGEWPVLSAKKSTLRRATPASPTEWHQDGAFLGAGTRTVNVWVALTPCGDTAPGVEVIPQAFDRIVETGTEGSQFDWSVSHRTAVGLGAPPAQSPVFEPGDALLFNQMTLHRTDIRPTMTDDRYAIESWFFAPSTYPYEQVPILF